LIDEIGKSDDLSTTDQEGDRSMRIVELTQMLRQLTTLSFQSMDRYIEQISGKTSRSDASVDEDTSSPLNVLMQKIQRDLCCRCHRDVRVTSDLIEYSIRLIDSCDTMLRGANSRMLQIVMSHSTVPFYDVFYSILKSSPIGTLLPSLLWSLLLLPFPLVYNMPSQQVFMESLRKLLDLFDTFHNMKTKVKRERAFKSSTPASLLDTKKEETTNTQHITSKEIEIIESEHPYKPGQNEKEKLIQFPGASCLILAFDDRCSLSADHCLLINQTLPQKTGETMTNVFYNSGIPRRFVVQGDAVGIKLSSGKSTTMSIPLWGFKIKVMPVYSISVQNTQTKNIFNEIQISIASYLGKCFAREMNHNVDGDSVFIEFSPILRGGLRSHESKQITNPLERFHYEISENIPDSQGSIFLKILNQKSPQRTPNNISSVNMVHRHA